MPKVNTFNYDTIASWNGSEDLFVVEQPDGTKVATPAMVKQFIEAGDFEATGEVKDGHGNILKDMAKSADLDDIADEIDNINGQNSYNPNLMKNRGDAIGDLNDIKVNGFYTYRTTNTNTPSSWGTLMVINVTPNNPSLAWIFQLAFSTDARIYLRKSINGSAFSSWVTVI